MATAIIESEKMVYQKTAYRTDRKNTLRLRLVTVLGAVLMAGGSQVLAATVSMQTSKGVMELELDAKAAPVTVANFLKYAKAGHYDGTIFHRVIDGFMIQGGGFNQQMRELETAHPAIKLEANNGLKNTRATIAMARTPVPDSARAQFFINVKDNPSLNAPSPDGHGYAVFGRVTKGMEVVDAIKGVKTATQIPHANVPEELPVITKATMQGKHKVRLQTTVGDMVLQLNADKAPLSVKNFEQYVKDGHYNGTVFHRVIKDFVIQAGGMDAQLKEKKTRKAIRLEADNGLKNTKGTVAMARTSAPDSATAQFFINVKDNPNLDASKANGAGYAVFGKVITGMDVVEKIRQLKTYNIAPHENVPIEPVVIQKVTIIKP